MISEKTNPIIYEICDVATSVKFIITKSRKYIIQKIRKNIPRLVTEALNDEKEAQSNIINCLKDVQIFIMKYSVRLNHTN